MKKTNYVLGFVALLLLTSLLALPVFAIQDEESNTTNGYTATALVWGTYHNPLVYPYTWKTTASCTPGTYHCTAMGYNLTIFGAFVATVGGSQVCYYNPCQFIAIAASSSVYSGYVEATDSVHHAGEVENYGYAGYWHSAQFTAVTQEVYAGIPAN